MNAETLLLVVLAIGTGISIGWVLKAWHGKLNPEGQIRLAESLGEQIAGMRRDTKDQVQEERARSEREKSDLKEEIASWRAYSMQVATEKRATPTRELEPEPSPRREEEQFPLEEQQAQVKRALMSKGMSAEVADAVARNDLTPVAGDKLIEALTDGVLREETGVT